MTADSDNRRPRNLVWLPNRANALTTMCRGAVLTIEQRSERQYPWTVEVGGHKVSEGVSPSIEHAQDAAVDAAVEIAGGALKVGDGVPLTKTHE